MRFRKKQLIELVDWVLDENNKLTGVRVQNEGNSEDQWVIPIDVFETTYERVDAE